MEPKWYYEYCKPLYEKLKIVLITGGDAFVAKESYNYMKFLSENYPQITVMTESNGIAFNEQFRELACENLFKPHFSINASNVEIYQKGCWAGEAGANGYQMAMKNIRAYMDLLRSKNLECFGPSLSMVINKDTACDVVDFAKLALQLGASYIIYYFDCTENYMEGEYFSNPKIIRPALKKLMELERVLAKKFFVYFRLWIPTKETAPIQAEVDAEPLSELQEKYADVLKLAANRNMKDELELRNRIRAANEKKMFLFDEDYSPTVRKIEKEGKKVCFAPWNELDLYPNGRMDFCGWFRETLNIKNFIKDDKVDWDAVLNSEEYIACRYNIMHDNYDGCMPECPMNDCKLPITQGQLCDTVIRDYHNIQKVYTDLETGFRGLQSQYSSLESYAKDLQNQYGSLESYTKDLQNAYGSLKTGYDQLQNLIASETEEKEKSAKSLEELRQFESKVKKTKWWKYLGSKRK